MSDVVIRAEGLGKRYLIGHNAAQAERYSALRDVAARTAKGLARSAREMLRGRQLVGGDEVEEFWALKDVNFEIKRGEVVGIIGRNGAGKSTLLKILSRITEPSTGRVEIKGRVASLLEVGTGFHPELTGRENIYLNGAILGMTRAEIRRKFDEIVAFAEIERFLDTPVKRYSSGMYVRLAFAVAAHLEPEILVVDEVLAVGDAEFQKKCLGKMGEVAGRGRTVLFVSHNIAAIKNLCPISFFFQNGLLRQQGKTNIVFNAYLTPGIQITQNMKSILVMKTATLNITPVRSQECPALEFNMTAIAKQDTEVAVNLILFDQSKLPVLFASCGGFGSPSIRLATGQSSCSFSLPATLIAAGTYTYQIEIIDKIRGSSYKSTVDFPFEWEGQPLDGHSICLRQDWGVGCINQELRIRQIKQYDGVEH